MLHHMRTRDLHTSKYNSSSRVARTWYVTDFTATSRDSYELLHGSPPNRSLTKSRSETSSRGAVSPEKRCPYVVVRTSFANKNFT